MPEVLHETSHEGLDPYRGGSWSSHEPGVDFVSLLPGLMLWTWLGQVQDPGSVLQAGRHVHEH